MVQSYLAQAAEKSIVLESNTLVLGQRTDLDTGLSIFNIIVGLLGISLLLGIIILFFYVLVDILRRNDLKKSRLLWLVLWFFAFPVGVVAYGFIEGRKSLAWWAIGLICGVPCLLLLYSVVSVFAG